MLMVNKDHHSLDSSNSICQLCYIYAARFSCLQNWRIFHITAQPLYDAVNKRIPRKFKHGADGNKLRWQHIFTMITYEPGKPGQTSLCICMYTPFTEDCTGWPKNGTFLVRLNFIKY